MTSAHVHTGDTQVGSEHIHNTKIKSFNYNENLHLKKEEITIIAAVVIYRYWKCYNQYSILQKSLQTFGVFIFQQ